MIREYKSCNLSSSIHSTERILENDVSNNIFSISEEKGSQKIRGDESEKIVFPRERRTEDKALAPPRSARSMYNVVDKNENFDEFLSSEDKIDENVYNNVSVTGQNYRYSPAVCESAHSAATRRIPPEEPPARSLAGHSVGNEASVGHAMGTSLHDISTMDPKAGVDSTTAITPSHAESNDVVNSVSYVNSSISTTSHVSSVQKPNVSNFSEEFLNAVSTVHSVNDIRLQNIPTTQKTKIKKHVRFDSARLNSVVYVNTKNDTPVELRKQIDAIKRYTNNNNNNNNNKKNKIIKIIIIIIIL